MEKSRKHPDQLAPYRDAYPECTDEEREAIRNTLVEYLGILLRICEDQPNDNGRATSGD